MREYTMEEVSKMILDMAKSQAEKVMIDEAKYKALEERPTCSSAPTPAG